MVGTARIDDYSENEEMLMEKKREFILLTAAGAVGLGTA